MRTASTTRRHFLRYVGIVPLAVMSEHLISRSSAQQCSPTTSDIEGPYYLPYAPSRSVLAGPDEPGRRLVIRGSVLATDCSKTISGALLDIWQADTQGRYYNESENYRLRGKVLTDKSGSYELTTIVPGNYRQGAGMRPAHIHFIATHPDFKELTTQLYFKGDPYLPPNDSCGDACKSNDTNRIIELKLAQKGVETWLEGRFDLVLRPAK
jgi:catechol 1,2-dioxygenase